MSQRPSSAPGRGTTWRPRTKAEHQVLVPFGRRRQTDPRCSVHGLLNGADCKEHRTTGSAYCYYHDKVERGLITTFMATGATCEWVEAAPSRIFPVYPLPRGGYVLLEGEQ